MTEPRTFTWQEFTQVSTFPLLVIVAAIVGGSLLGWWELNLATTGPLSFGLSVWVAVYLMLYTDLLPFELETSDKR